MRIKWIILLIFSIIIELCCSTLAALVWYGVLGFPWYVWPVALGIGLIYAVCGARCVWALRHPSKKAAEEKVAVTEVEPAEATGTFDVPEYLQNAPEEEPLPEEAFPEPEEVNIEEEFSKALEEREPEEEPPEEPIVEEEPVIEEEESLEEPIVEEEPAIEEETAAEEEPLEEPIVEEEPTSEEEEAPAEEEALEETAVEEISAEEDEPLEEAIVEEEPASEGEEAPAEEEALEEAIVEEEPAIEEETAAEEEAPAGEEEPSAEEEAPEEPVAAEEPRPGLLLAWEYDGDQESLFVSDFPLVIGNSMETAHLAIPDESVSPAHTCLIYVDGAYYAEDLGSAGGTWVNGDRITTMTQVFVGDVLTIGDVAMGIME